MRREKKKKVVNRKSWLISQLRRISMRWPPRNTVYKSNRRELPRRFKKDGTPFKKPSFEHQCNSCKEWFKAGKITMDHINPVIEVDRTEVLSEAEFIGRFAISLLCYEDNWQKLCESCNKEKTDKENEQRLKNKQNT